MKSKKNSTSSGISKKERKMIADIEKWSKEFSTRLNQQKDKNNG